MKESYIKFLIIVCTVILFSSCNKKYNLKIYRETDHHKYLYVKGNVDIKRIPNGDFIFYNEKGRKEARGKYENGLKKGAWTYNIDKKEVDFYWDEFNKDGIRFPYLNTWKIKDQAGFLFCGIENKSGDSIVDEMFRVRIYNMEEGFEDFNNYCRSYMADLKSRNKILSTYDYTPEFKENFPDIKNVSFFQFTGKDNAGYDFMAIFFLINIEKSKEIVELHYITANEDGKTKYKAFTEILYDAYYHDKLLIGRLW